jgi:hypothetical protein
LKRYAESLGIDPELVMERYLRTLKEAQEADAQRESAPVSRGARRRSFKVWPAAVIALTLAAIGFFVARPLLAPRSAGSDNAAPKHAASRPEPRPSALPSIEDAAGSAVDAENQSVSEEGEGGIRESTPTSNSGPSGSPTDAPRTKPVEIQVKLTEGCWLEVISDGALQMRAVRPAGETLSFAGDDSIRIRFGNPQGAQVSWNGREVPLPESDPTTRLFTATAVTVVKPASKSAPSKPVTSKQSQAGSSATATPSAGTTAPPAQTLPPGAGNGVTGPQPATPASQG